MFRSIGILGKLNNWIMVPRSIHSLIPGICDLISYSQKECRYDHDKGMEIDYPGKYYEETESCKRKGTGLGI